MSDTPAAPEFDPEVDQDWDTDEHGPMADHATADEDVELEES